MKYLLPFLFLLPLSVSATTIIPYTPAPGFFATAYYKITHCWFDVKCYSQPILGSTITAISGTTFVSTFPTIYNTNNTNLNNDKFELTDWYATTSAPQITTLGTITTGTWSGTAIAVAKGGTGTTSPSTYSVLLGNGANGITVASSTGTSGQLLTSNGAGAYPSWTTVTADQAANYTWTGNHLFTASTTHTATTSIAASSVTGKALQLNGVPYSFPSSGIASSTAWAFDATGKATYWPLQSYSSGQFATTTGIGDLVITHGMGAVPKMVVLHVYETDTVSGTNHINMEGSATAVGGGNSTSMCVVSTGATSITSNSSNIINIVSGANCTGTTIYTATLSAWTTTTFTLNFTVAAGNGTFKGQWEAYQ